MQPFSHPAGAPDNPQKADLAIDGNPDTSWPTVTYKDPVPFPNFIEGEGLLLHLSEPTALSAVTIDLSSTGTEVQIRSSPTETPAKLADTTELTPTTPLQPGHNRIESVTGPRHRMCWCGSPSWARPMARAGRKSPRSRCRRLRRVEGEDLDGRRTHPIRGVDGNLSRSRLVVLTCFMG